MIIQLLCARIIDQYSDIPNFGCSFLENCKRYFGEICMIQSSSIALFTIQAQMYVCFSCYIQKSSGGRILLFSDVFIIFQTLPDFFKILQQGATHGLQLYKNWLSYCLYEVN